MSFRTSYLLGPAGPDQEEEGQTDKDKVRRGVERVEKWTDYFSINIQNGRDDIYFLYQSQWDPDLYDTRISSNKSCLQVNTIYAIIVSLLGRVRSNTPSFAVRATVDNHNPKVHVDQDAIDLRESILRQIFFENNSSVVFQTAAQASFCRGFGAILVYTDYENENSFRQKIFHRAWNDPSCTFFDPEAEEPTKEDGRHCGFLERYTRKEFRNRYPDAKATLEKKTPQSFPSMSSYRKFQSLWGSEDMITVSHEFVFEEKPITLALLSDGRSMELSEANEEIERYNRLRSQMKSKEKKVNALFANVIGIDNSHTQSSQYPALKIEDTRKSTRKTLVYRELSYDEVLKEEELPIKSLPMVFVDGDSHYIDGIQYTKSFQRMAKDPQRIQNILISDSVDCMINAHKALFLGTPENFKGYERLWRDPTNTPGALIANRDAAGMMPQKLDAPMVSPSYAPLIQQAQGDVQRTLGYFAANQGQESNETSGLAVNNRSKQGDLGSFLYYDNLERAVDRTAKLSLEWMPHIFDTNTQLMTQSPDGVQTALEINKPTQWGVENDLTAKNFTVDVTVSSPYEIQKQENMDQLQQLLQTIGPADPTLAVIMSDLYASNLDLENTTQIVDRIRGHILGLSPQEILQHEMGIKSPPKPQQPDPQAMQMQIEQQKMQIEQQKLALDKEKLDLDKQKLGLDAQKNNNELTKIHTERESNALDAHVEASKNMMELETAKMDTHARLVESKDMVEAAKAKPAPKPSKPKGPKKPTS